MNSNGGIISISAGSIFLIFLTLKLAQIGLVASWSWWWVFSPIWIPIVIVGLILLAMGLFAIIAALYYKYFANEDVRKRYRDARAKTKERNRIRNMSLQDRLKEIEKQNQERMNNKEIK